MLPTPHLGAQREHCLIKSETEINVMLMKGPDIALEPMLSSFMQ